jgi:energy-coupling factor transport system substrate-specific component
MNLFSWPFAAPGLESDAGLFWYPGLSLAETARRYWSFYLVTSLTHDLTRAAANVALVLVAGAPILRLLDRFRARAHWESAATEAVHPEENISGGSENVSWE